MKINKFETEEAWLQARLGKITGTRLKDLISKRNGEAKIGFYEVIAENIAIPATGESAMDRGKRLEDEAMDRFEEETGKKVNRDLVIWLRDDEPRIAVSPDGSIGKTEAIETKCLSSARFLEALVTQKIPSEYDYQILQYFVVNDKLKTLYFAFYDPRMPKDFFFFTIHRKDRKKEIAELLELQKDVLKKIAEVEKQIVF